MAGERPDDLDRRRGADEKIRGRQQFFLYEKQGNNHAPKAAIPVQKWMKCLELGVNDSELD